MIRFILVVLSLGNSISFADNYYSKEIEKFAETLVSHQYEAQFELLEAQKLHIKAYPLSSIRTFEKCDELLQGTIIGDKIKAKTTVKVSCNSPVQWDVYIRLQVQLMAPLIVASHPLNKGERIDKGNTMVIYKEQSKIRSGFFSDKREVIGTRLKRNVAAKRAIRLKDICHVCKDDKVTITANKKGLVIHASGIALNDGNIGASIKVKNSRTQRVIVGTVDAVKEVYVTF